MKYFLAILLGFLLHKTCDEIINLNLSQRYKKCVKYSNRNIEKSPYQQCRHTLDYNKLESILMYQPEFWNKNEH